MMDIPRGAAEDQGVPDAALLADQSEANRALVCIADPDAVPVLDVGLVQLLGESDEDLQYRKLVAHVRSDPGLAGRVLRVANSAYYSRSGLIRSIEQAMAVLGSQAVLGITVVASLGAVRSPLSEDAQASVRALRRHSLRVAIAARLLSARKRMHLWLPDAAFLLGLLHDLGYVVELQLQAAHAAETQQEPLPAARWLGGALLTRWQMPAQFIAVVRGHGGPRGTENSIDTDLLFLADQLALRAEASTPHHLREPDDALPLVPFKLEAGELEDWAARIGQEAESMEAALGG